MSGLTGAFDNMDKMRREMWVEGEMRAFISAHCLYQRNGSVHTVGEKFAPFGKLPNIRMVDGMACVMARDFTDSEPTDFYTLLRYNRNKR